MSETETAPVTTTSPTVDRALVNEVLKKVGIDDPAGFPLERAISKLAKRVYAYLKEGRKLELTDGENAVVDQCFTITGLPKPSADTKPAVEAAQQYYLPGNGAGQKGRLDTITETVAKVRNQNRKDDRRWTLATPEQIASVNDSGGDPNTKAADPDRIPLTEAMKDNKKPATKTKTKDKTPAPTKTPAAKSKTATTAPKGTTAAPKGEEKVHKPRSEGGVAIFKGILAKGKTFDKADLIKQLAAAGVKEATATSYICWAKRPIKNALKNPFGFRVEEEKKDGKKIITRVTGG